jgi:hypothetical protein
MWSHIINYISFCSEGTVKKSFNKHKTLLLNNINDVLLSSKPFLPFKLNLDIKSTFLYIPPHVSRNLNLGIFPSDMTIILGKYKHITLSLFEVWR